ncbi:MAG: hypothetical protein MI802_18810, partial [Desulfobacterales bacterium]|nr:hypothetical protein [Desulfobacterales bacterium]
DVDTSAMENATSEVDTNVPAEDQTVVEEIVEGTVDTTENVAEGTADVTGDVVEGTGNAVEDVVEGVGGLLGGKKQTTQPNK